MWFFFFFLLGILLKTVVVGVGGAFPGVPVAKNPPANAGNAGSIPGSGRPPGEGNGYPRQYSCLENSMDREAWWVTVHEVAKSRT